MCEDMSATDSHYTLRQILMMICIISFEGLLKVKLSQRELLAFQIFRRRKQINHLRMMKRCKTIKMNFDTSTIKYSQTSNRKWEDAQWKYGQVVTNLQKYTITNTTYHFIKKCNEKQYKHKFLYIVAKTVN